MHRNKRDREGEIDREREINDQRDHNVQTKTIPHMGSTNTIFFLNSPTTHPFKATRVATLVQHHQQQPDTPSNRSSKTRSAIAV